MKLHWHEVLFRFGSRNVIEKYFCRLVLSQNSQLHKLGGTIISKTGAVKINQNESSDAGQSEKRTFSRAEKVFHMGLFKVSPPNEFASSSPPAFGLCLAFSTPPGPAEAADRAPSPSSFLLLLISGSTTPLGRRAAPLASRSRSNLETIDRGCLLSDDFFESERRGGVRVQSAAAAGDRPRRPAGRDRVRPVRLPGGCRDVHPGRAEGCGQNREARPPDRGGGDPEDHR